MSYIWLDGKIVPREEAKVSVFDHGLLYGDGCFEGIRAYGGRILKLKTHLARMFESASLIHLAPAYDLEQIEDGIRETMDANGITDGYIRLVFTRGVGTLGLHPFRCPTPGTFIIADKIQLYPEELYEQGMAVIVAKRPPSWAGAFNGWGGSFLAVFIPCFAPVCSVAGTVFEWWSTREAHVRRLVQKRLVFTIGMFVPLAAAAGGTMAVELSYSPQEIELAPLVAPQVLLLLACDLVVITLGIAWLLVELRPQSSGLGGHEHFVFDANLQWEARTALLAWKHWFNTKREERRARRLHSWWRHAHLVPALTSFLQLYGFWVLVWIVKNVLAYFILLPACFDAHLRISQSFSVGALAAAHPGAGSFFSEPAALYQVCLIALLWATVITVYVADTLFWYAVTVGLVGGVRGVSHHGVAKSSRHTVPSAASLRAVANAKLLQGLEVGSAAAVATAGAAAGAAAQPKGWDALWQAMVDELHKSDLITDVERSRLLEDEERIHVANAEARRRLHHFERSLSDPDMRPSNGAIRAPGMTVLVPCYGETSELAHQRATGYRTLA